MFKTKNKITALIAIYIFVLFASSANAVDEDAHGHRFVNDSQALSKDRVLEFWAYHNYQGNNEYQNTLTMRYYNPLEIGDWHGRIRLDSSVVSTYGSNTSENSAGQYSAGQTMVTVWGQDKIFLKNLGALVGARVIFPFGNSTQWAIGPQLNWSYVPEVKTLFNVTDFSPLTRYLYGFDAKNNSTSTNPGQTPLLRTLQIYPTIGFSLSPSTTLRLWDENGISYNSAGGGWFVPIDAMVLHRLTKNLVIAVGASKQVVQTYQQYDWSTYAKISLNF